MLKLVKAVVRLELLEEVVAALKDTGVPRLTISHIRAVGSGADPKRMKFSLELGTGYTEKALVQFICAADRVDSVIRVICEHACTSRRGDGIVFVLPIEGVTKIRTGLEGIEAIL